MLQVIDVKVVDFNDYRCQPGNVPKTVDVKGC